MYIVYMKIISVILIILFLIAVVKALIAIIEIPSKLEEINKVLSDIAGKTSQKEPHKGEENE